MPNSNQIPTNPENNLFAIEIESERLKAAAPVGWNVLFDKELKPRHNNIVLVSFDNDNQCQMMFYIVIDEHVYLNPVEDDLEQFELTRGLNATIHGVAIKRFFYKSGPILPMKEAAQ